MDRKAPFGRRRPAAIRYTQFKLAHGVGQQPQFSRRTFRMETARQGRPVAVRPVAFDVGR